MRAAGLVLLAVLALPIEAAAQTCLKSSSENVTLVGTLGVVRHRHPNGTPLSAYVLTLPQPVCVHDPDDKDSPFQKQERVRQVQLAPDTDKVKNLGTLVGKRMTATGDLFAGHTAYHIRPLLMLAKSAAAAP